MSQQYSLRWNNHQPNFISMFTTLLNTQTLVDVTLAAEGKHLKAHKVVLSACSTYFQAVLVDNPSRHPIVILKDVSYSDLRTMVDFMYYGEVNVTEEQLPQVLDTAKLLKIKGLTEMPDSTSLTRSQGTTADFQSPGDSIDSQRHSASPAASPSNKRRRRRKSSTGSTSLNMVPEENRNDEAGQSVDLVRGDSITLSSVPQQRRMREFQDEQMDNVPQPTDQHNLHVDQLSMDNNQAIIPQGGQWSMMEHTYPRYSNACVGGGGGGGTGTGSGGLQPDHGLYMNNVINPHMNDSDMNDYDSFSSESSLRLRRSKFSKRQSRVPDERELRKQISEPAPPSGLPVLQKHESYPQYTSNKSRRLKPQEREVGSLLIRLVDRQSSTTTSTSTSFDTQVGEGGVQTQRASHTPAVRDGPPLSCNFCWNTVDECGRILRRKTQYHCPECRTNLCIVPCFHEYHDLPEAETGASAR